jgi:tellurite resistance protein
MGLFDAFREQTQPSATALGPAEGFAAILLLVTAADGYLADDESRLLSVTLQRMKLFRSYSSDVISRMIDKLCGMLRREGIEVLLEAAINALPHDLYETAFAIATDLILSDGEVTKEEETLLGILCHKLELNEGDASQIIKVMLIKNQG